MKNKNEIQETEDKITETPQAPDNAEDQAVITSAPESTPAAIYTSEPEPESMSYAGSCWGDVRGRKLEGPPRLLPATNPLCHIKGF